ncbi:MAG: hypothetical protein ACJ76K_14735 [Solirubrobacteraceae bacterium]|jgi:hypothetical protein
MRLRRSLLVLFALAPGAALAPADAQPGEARPDLFPRRLSL